MCSHKDEYETGEHSDTSMYTPHTPHQTVFLPLIGLVKPEDLKPGDLIGVNKDSYLILDTLPPEFDSRVKAMEVDERPTEKYTVSFDITVTHFILTFYKGHWWS